MQFFVRRSFRKGTVAALTLFALFFFAGRAPAQESLAPTAAELGEEFGALAEAVSPAVVHLSAVRVMEREESPGGRSPGMPFPFPMPRGPQRQHGLGSGVIVRADGYILTNNHLVADATDLKVRLTDGREFDAETVGTDPETDLAVLKVEAQDLPTAELGKDDIVEVGQFVLAIGNPFGLARSVSFGIVSAKGRAQMGITEFEDFIQTDAAINPGNSGGPLVNMEGRVIGISTAIFSRTGGNLGIGFAVPAGMAHAVMTSIIEKGHVTRGWLGVSIQDMTGELAEAMGLDKGEGALVAQVLEDTPAHKAGFEQGDVIVEVDGEKVRDATELRNKIAHYAPETEVEVTVLRDGEERKLPVRLAERPSTDRPTGVVEGRYGFSVANITDQLRQQFGIETEQGVVVTAVKEGGTAWRAGLRPGAVVTQANRKPVANVEEFNEIVKKTGEGQNLLLHVSFQDMSSYVLIRPEGN